MGGEGEERVGGRDMLERAGGGCTYLGWGGCLLITCCCVWRLALPLWSPLGRLALPFLPTPEAAACLPADLEVACLICV